MFPSTRFATVVNQSVKLVGRSISQHCPGIAQAVGWSVGLSVWAFRDHVRAGSGDGGRKTRFVGGFILLVLVMICHIFFLFAYLPILQVCSLLHKKIALGGFLEPDR